MDRLFALYRFGNSHCLGNQNFKQLKHFYEKEHGISRQDYQIFDCSRSSYFVFHQHHYRHFWYRITCIGSGICFNQPGELLSTVYIGRIEYLPGKKGLMSCAEK